MKTSEASAFANDVPHSQAATIARETTLTGVGFFSGQTVSVRLIPAEPNHGIVFHRTDLPDSTPVPVSVRYRVAEPRRTVLQHAGARVELTEHLVAALVGMGVGNCRIELDGPEPPGFDGSALAFVEAIGAAGLERQGALRTPLVVEASVHVGNGSVFLAAHPGLEGRLEVTCNIDYADNPGIGPQSYYYAHSTEAFVKEIAPARTFIQEKEVVWLRGQGIGKRTTARDLLVFADDGSVVDNQLRFPDECVRHKILDILGDLGLVGRPVAGHIVAHRSGHAMNAALATALLQHEEDLALKRWRSEKPILDSTQIETILPHRFPFLLVDRVVELEADRRAVGIKNVTYNEPFFQGHWPNRPVMPGVLIVEAMAQLAGLTLKSWQKNSQNAMIVGMDGIRLRRPVTPGDQLRLHVDVVRLKTRNAVVRASAWVEKDLAAEAEIRLVLVDGDSSTPKAA